VADGLPVPELTDGAVRLRAWRTSDAPALVAAWADPDVRRFSSVPAARDEVAAVRWISAEADRRARRLALDLVVSPASGDDVLGEVGLGPFDPARNAAMVGYWVAAPARGRGVATAAVRLVTDWALDGCGLALAALVAATDPDNPASEAVLRSAAFTPLADRDGLRHWVRRA
jgi:[ribosomal protein S5]-alanine N-acetyltransferase